MDEFTCSIQGNTELYKTLYFQREKVIAITNTAILAALWDFHSHDTYASQFYANCAPATGAASTKTWKTVNEQDVKNTYMPIKLSPESSILITGVLHAIAKEKDLCEALDVIPDTSYTVTNSGEPKLDQDLFYSTVLEEFQGDNESVQISLKLIRKIAKFGALQKIQEANQTASNLSATQLRTIIFMDMKAEDIVKFAPLFEAFETVWKTAEIKKPIERNGVVKKTVNPNSFDRLSATAANTQSQVTKRQPVTK